MAFVIGSDFGVTLAHITDCHAVWMFAVYRLFANVKLLSAEEVVQRPRFVTIVNMEELTHERVGARSHPTRQGSDVATVHGTSVVLLGVVHRHQSDVTLTAIFVTEDGSRINASGIHLTSMGRINQIDGFLLGSDAVVGAISELGDVDAEWGELHAQECSVGSSMSIAFPVPHAMLNESRRR